MKAQKKSSSRRVAAHGVPTASTLQIKPGSVLDRMGGLPKYMLHGDGNASSRESRKQAVLAHVTVKAARRKAKAAAAPAINYAFEDL